jgi:UDP-2,3-diacylglucosamine hydrolase
LIGARFAREAGLTILPDPFLLERDGECVLLLHGDTLCTDDLAYQAFRKQARDPAWQAALLAEPYEARIAYAHRVRAQSNAEKSLKAEDIMDVNADTVRDVFRRYGVTKMIHGHTHRVATHLHDVDGKPCTRWVLADWHDVAPIFALPQSSGSAVGDHCR